MDTLMKADIFFFITSVAVVLLTLAVLYAAFYVIRILRSVDEIAEEVKEESQLVRDDLGDLRKNIREEGVKARHFMRFFDRMTGRHAARRTKKTDTV